MTAEYAACGCLTTGAENANVAEVVGAGTVASVNMMIEELNIHYVPEPNF